MTALQHKFKWAFFLGLAFLVLGVLYTAVTGISGALLFVLGSLFAFFGGLGWFITTIVKATKEP